MSERIFVARGLHPRVDMEKRTPSKPKMSIPRKKKLNKKGEEIKKDYRPVVAVVVARNIPDSTQWFLGASVCSQKDIPNKAGGILRAKYRAEAQENEFLGKLPPRKNKHLRATVNSFEEVDKLFKAIKEAVDPRIAILTYFGFPIPKAMELVKDEVG